MMSQPNQTQVKSRFLANFSFAAFNYCRTLLIVALTVYLVVFSYANKHLTFPGSEYFCPLFKTSLPEPLSPPDRVITSAAVSAPVKKPTDLSDIVFGILGSEKAWHHRRGYIESWWRPNVTRGFLFLDAPPAPDLLPWAGSSPPYRISDPLPQFASVPEIRPKRMVHGIMEVLRELGDEEFRWLVMGDDDSIFFVDNMVDVLAKIDHTKYHYIGGQSEFLMSNFWFSFDQGYGGAGIILSYPLAKVLAADIDNCLHRYVFLNSADNTTRNCIADLGVNVEHYRGNHQVNLINHFLNQSFTFNSSLISVLAVIILTTHPL